MKTDTSSTIRPSRGTGAKSDPDGRKPAMRPPRAASGRRVPAADSAASAGDGAQASSSPRTSGYTGNRRDEIVAAAIRVIARDGIRACTITALERETGFARGHFTYHFAAKEEIIGLAFATVASDWATTQMNAPLGGTARAALEYRVRAAVIWVLHHPEYFRCLMNFRVEMMRLPDAFPAAPRIRRQLWDFTAALIREGTAQGDFRPRAEPDVEARLVFATVDGLLLHAAMDPAFHADADLADHVWNVVAGRLGGRPS